MLYCRFSEGDDDVDGNGGVEDDEEDTLEERGSTTEDSEKNKTDPPQIWISKEASMEHDVD